MDISKPDYNKDIYGWAMHTAQLLRDRKMDELDYDNIIEEIESLGKSEKSHLRNYLCSIIAYLLQWQYQPGSRERILRCNANIKRLEAEFLLDDSPSLKEEMDEILLNAYKVAILRAARYTNLDETVFPAERPYSFEQIMDTEFYPDGQ